MTCLEESNVHPTFDMKQSSALAFSRREQGQQAKKQDLFSNLLATPSTHWFPSIVHTLSINMTFFNRAAVLTLLFAASASGFAPSPVAQRATFLRMADEASEFDFDVAIIGCGVGGHGAALHSRAQSLKTAVFSGNDVGGTCVNRGW